MNADKFFIGLLTAVGLMVIAGTVWLVHGNHPDILLFPSLGRAEKVHVTGRLLFEAPADGSGAFVQNVGGLAAPNWEKVSVDVEFQDDHQTVKTGDSGFFSATFDAPKTHSFEPGEYTAKASAHGVTREATVRVIASDTPFLVISDFDDTIAETHVLNKAELANSAFLKDGETQAAVSGMAEWYRCIEGSHATAPVFALVTGSPVQFLHRVGVFMKKNAFPFFGLYLRDLGPSTLANYKQPIIRQLMNDLPLPVVLIGDSGEHDPEVYGQIRREYGDRVMAIFIRDAGHAQDANRFTGMTLFHSPTEARVVAEQAKIESQTCQPVPALTKVSAQKGNEND